MPSSFSTTSICPAETKCQTCQVNTNAGEFENCISRLSKGRPDTIVITLQPSSVVPPPPTGSFPENIVLEANGNCTPKAQTPEEPPSTDQGTERTQDEDQGTVPQEEDNKL
jgi:hypothetical protein